MNDVIIEILPKFATVEEFSGVSEKTGKPFTMRTQIGFAHLDDEGYPERIKISLQKDQSHYPAGRYRLLPSSLRVGNYDQLQIGFLHLEPIL